MTSPDIVQPPAFPVIETARLILRQPRAQDAEALLDISYDQRVMQYYGMEPFKTLHDALAEVAWANDLFSLGQGIRWVITTRQEDVYIGDLGLHNHVKPHARAEVGYRLQTTHWRQGLMTEALRAAATYAFETMALNRIEALVDPRNAGSWRLLEKLGFQREGILRDYERERTGFVDLAMYSLLRREWEQPR